MKTQHAQLVVFLAMLVGLVSVEANAQSIIQDLRRVRRQFNQPPMSTYPVITQGTPRPVQSSPVQPGYPIYQQPAQYPVYVTPDQFNGYDPYTGRPNTKNEQVDNTYYDQNREASKHNGTRTWVRRPIHNAQGQVVGYQEGWVWRNSVTGVEHGELKNVTPNSQGGEHEQIQLKSVL